MALEDLNPAVRVEEILDGADIEPATRLEYFLKKAAGGGSGGLPPYTSADKGKVLTIVEGEESETTVIVPEQTVTVTETNGGVIADEGTLSSLSVDDHVSLIVDGAAYPSTVYEGAGGAGYLAVYPDDETIGYTVEQVIGDTPTTHKTLFTAFDGEGANIPGTYTISVIASVPSVEPKWEAAGGIEVISIGSVTASNGADNAIYVNGQELTTLEECAEYLESVQDKVLYVQMTGLPEGAIFKSIVTGITVYRAANYAYGEFVQKMPSLNAQTFGYMPASD